MNSKPSLATMRSNGAAEAPRPVAIVVGALAPYTDLLYDRLASALDRPLNVLACCRRERDRHWEIPPRPHYRFEVCPGFAWYRNSLSTVYFNPKMALRLRELRPSVMVLNDFSPTMMMAAWAARALGVPYGVRTDGRMEHDLGQTSRSHYFLRRRIVSGAAFGLGASRGSLELLRAYGLGDRQGLVAPLFPAWNSRPEALLSDERPFDVLFCGSLNDEIKGALFFADVVLSCAHRGRNLKVRVVGEGPLRATLQEKFAAAGVDAQFDGFLPQHRLAESYGSAKLFLFPSRGDVWGVVVQEALQSGACVIASPHAGASAEIVEAYACGLVLPLERDVWADNVLQLLAAPGGRAELNKRAATALADHSIERAIVAYQIALRPYL